MVGGNGLKLFFGGDRTKIFVAIFHLTLPQLVFTRICMSLGQYHLEEVCVGGGWVVLKVSLVLALVQTQNLGFGFGLGPS